MRRCRSRELVETLTILDAAGANGAFVAEFVTAGATFSEEPRYDLDMNAFALVRTYRNSKGTTYQDNQDMNWEPKRSFHAVAKFYAHHTGQTRLLAPDWPLRRQVGRESIGGTHCHAPSAQHLF